MRVRLTKAYLIYGINSSHMIDGCFRTHYQWVKELRKENENE